MENKLNIVRFIEEHRDSWEELLTQKPYCLKIKRSSFADGHYVMFNYDMIESDNYDPIVKEARGIVLHIEDGCPVTIARKGFNRFFNIGEGHAAQIDWNTAEATIKEDGTLVFASFYYGVWHFGTRQNFDLEDAGMSSELYPTFKDLWDSVAKQYPNLRVENLNRYCTYCFELCSRHNRIVIDYPQPKIFLLAVFDNEFQYEWPYESVECAVSRLGCDIPKRYQMASESDYAKLIEDFGIQHEGLVVRDAYDNRIKMKSKLYFNLHKTVSNGAMDREAICGLVRKGEQAEFLSYFPEYKEKFDEIEKLVSDAMAEIAVIRTYAKIAKDMGLNRKQFALLHKDEKTSMLWFKAWEDKLTDDFVASITDEKFLQLFG